MLFGSRMGVPKPSSNMEDRDSPHQQAIFGYQQGVLRIQLNSDSVYLKIQSDFTRLLLHPRHKHISEAQASEQLATDWRLHRFLPTQDANHKFRLLLTDWL